MQSVRPVTNSTGWSTPTAALETQEGPTVISCSTYLSDFQTASFQQGRQGEDEVIQCLTSWLDRKWFIFRNFVIPGDHEDIDVVLVGPAGIFALEIKNYNGNITVENGRWSVETSSGYEYHKSRGANAQVRDNARRLYSFIEKSGITKSGMIQPLVVLAGSAKANIISSGTEVIRVEDLPHKLRGMCYITKLPTLKIGDVVHLLATASKPVSTAAMGELGNTIEDAVVRAHGRVRRRKNLAATRNDSLEIFIKCIAVIAILHGFSTMGHMQNIILLNGAVGWLLLGGAILGAGVKVMVDLKSGYSLARSLIEIVLVGILVYGTIYGIFWYLTTNYLDTGKPLFTMPNLALPTPKPKG